MTLTLTGWIGLALLVDCGMLEPPRAAIPADKGIELYSWRPAGEDWHFSLLPGTNRWKERSEITGSGTAMTDIGRLRRELAGLAEGQSVFWRVFPEQPVPGELVGELSGFCEEQGLQLQIITMPGPRPGPRDGG